MSFLILKKMKILANKEYSEVPTPRNILKYPTIMDLMEELSEKERKKIDSHDPFRPNILSPAIRKGSYVITKEADSEFAEIFPCGQNLFFLYRGQNKYYENCQPVLFRNCESSEYEQLLSNLQIAEMKILLNSHPILNELTRNILYHCQLGEPVRLAIHYHGLAQHYGIHTNLLDFTNDKWVAAFFAVTEYIDGLYIPIVEKTRKNTFGVFYIYNWDGKETDGQFEVRPIGLHYFNRPGAQSGFAFEMKKARNLNDLHVVKKIFFRHDPEASSIIYSMNQRGKALFPEDSLVDKVKAIVGKNIFSLAAMVECNASYYHLNYETFMELIDKYGIQIQGEPVVSFSGDVLNKEWTDWQRGGRDRYINSLILLPVFRSSTP